MATLSNRLQALEQASDANAELPVRIRVIFHATDGSTSEGPSFNVQRTGHPIERKRVIHIKRSYGALKK